MKSIHKILVASGMAAALALTGCAGETEANEKPAASPSASAPASESAAPTPTPSETVGGPYVAAEPDYTNPSPMNIDVTATVKNTATPDIFDYYTEEQVVQASTFGLNWLEQITALPVLYDKDRNIPEDDVLVTQPFMEAMAPHVRGGVMETLKTQGLLASFPVANSEGTISAGSFDLSDPSKKLSDMTFPYYLGANGVPEITWSNVVVELGISNDTQQPLVRTLVTAEYAAADADGNPKSVRIQYTIGSTPPAETLPIPTIIGWQWYDITPK